MNGCLTHIICDELNFLLCGYVNSWVCFCTPSFWQNCEICHLLTWSPVSIRFLFTVNGCTRLLVMNEKLLQHWMLGIWLKISSLIGTKQTFHLIIWFECIKYSLFTNVYFSLSFSLSKYIYKNIIIRITILQIFKYTDSIYICKFLRYLWIYGTNCILISVV